VKDFLLFAGDIHYPRRAFGDFLKDFDTLADAKEYLISINCEWWSIIYIGCDNYMEVSCGTR